MENKKYRKVIYYKDYFKEFFAKQPLQIKKKIVWTIELIEDHENISEKYLKHLTGTDGLYEIRINFGTDIFRIFCFFNKGNLIVLMNAFQKKSQKTPPNQIELALKIKREYEQEN